ncbi:5'-nucleotidase C-terminal domain-containing protein [Winogradskyella sp.]
MANKHYVLLLLSFLVLCCRQSNNESTLTKIEGERIEINNDLKPKPEIEEFIAPYRENVNKNLDSVISYAPETYAKGDGAFNTAIGNFMADAVLEEGNIIFNKRTGHNIDLVLLNFGGIRSIISQGDITTRTAYEVMPFENSVVVVGMKGDKVMEMMNYLSKAKKAHPVSKQLQLTLGKDFEIASVSIHDKPIVLNKTYYVATNDYLYNGGDRMGFFQPNEGLEILDYKIRNVLIDHFKKHDTIHPKRDNRFIKLND